MLEVVRREGRLQEITIASAVVFTALAVFFQKPLHALGRRYRTTKAEHFKALQGPLTVAAGAVFRVYLYPLRLTPPRLIATDILHAIPLAMFAGMGHSLMGNVNLSLLGNLLAGSIPAVIVGAILSARLPDALLRGALAVVLLIIGMKLWWTLLQ